MFEPLKISCRLQTAVTGDQNLPLDAILYHQAMRDAYGVETVTGTLEQLGIAPVMLPLDMRGQGAQWYYAASFAQWETPSVDFTDHWHKRFDLSLADLIDGQGKKLKISVNAGRYKAYRMPKFARHSLSVHWFAFGDKSEIERLLSFCFFIGKKTSQGDGAICTLNGLPDWTVESVDFDSSVRDAEGRLMRPVPATRGVYMGFRPSYWERANQTICEWI